jgi:hypothetical protein
METCMIGLFLLAIDQYGESSCIPRAVVAAILLHCTGTYQMSLNRMYGALIQYLPIVTDEYAHPSICKTSES